MQKLTALTLIALSISYGCNTAEKMDAKALQNFATHYAEAWSGGNPEALASFYDEQGSLQVNSDAPATGREAIAKVAAGFMQAYPDMVVTMDSLVTHADGGTFYWSFTGTHSGPGGTGKTVRISGNEQWQISKQGLITQSKGSYDAADWNRQLYGSDSK